LVCNAGTGGFLDGDEVSIQPGEEDSIAWPHYKKWNKKRSFHKEGEAREVRWRDRKDGPNGEKKGRSSNWLGAASACSSANGFDTFSVSD
jgi:hypothetical protein